MTVPEKTRHHRVLPVDQVGDTLVVIPAGDAVGFGLNVVHNEVATVAELVRTGPATNLIIDLGRANYFGSVLIGEFLRIAAEVREKGGRVAVCSASGDMQDILRIMKLDTMWEIFPDLGSALRAIARVPIGERILRQKRAFAVLGIIAAVVLAWFLIPRPQYERRYYAEAAKLIREMSLLRQRKASEDEWAVFERKARLRLDPINAHLVRYSNASRPTAREVLWLTRDSVPVLIEMRNEPFTGPSVEFAYDNLVALEAALGIGREEATAPLIAPQGSVATTSPTAAGTMTPTLTAPPSGAPAPDRPPESPAVPNTAPADATESATPPAPDGSP